jgi:hypothetical protein
MARRKQDIDHILGTWKYEPGEVQVRVIQGADGRDVLQMRVDLGVLQLEMENRPDGVRPGGYETFLDYLISESIRLGPDFTMGDEECLEVDREFVQYYHRRVCWLSLRDFERAVRDADHTLALMDFAKKHSPSDEWTLSHEQYRPFVLFHRTQASALAALEQDQPEEAIVAIGDGLERMRQFFDEYDAEERYGEDEMVERLQELRDTLRDRYQVGKTLAERLAEAVETEQYELAAQLRDEIRRQRNGR